MITTTFQRCLRLQHVPATTTTAAGIQQQAAYAMMARRAFSRIQHDDGSAGNRDEVSTSCATSNPLSHQMQRHSSSSCNYFHSSSKRPMPDIDAVADLFAQYAKKRNEEWTLDAHDICELLKGLGREQCLTLEHGSDVVTPNSFFVEKLFALADVNGNGLIDIDEFTQHAYAFIGDNPAGIILVVGGPGSGKGVLSDRLERECNVVHLSSGKLLRDEVDQDTVLGNQVRDIMARGELVSSALMVALMKKRMKNHPGKRVVLDGFPRSMENAHDLVTICGRPELALHLVCDDTVLMERIMNRKYGDGENREDDNFTTALQRIRTYHKYQHTVLEWLRQQHIPIVNLDCEGSQESVWNQMTAIGKLMRPAVKRSGLVLGNIGSNNNQEEEEIGDRGREQQQQEDWSSSSSDPFRSSAV